MNAKRFSSTRLNPGIVVLLGVGVLAGVAIFTRDERKLPASSEPEAHSVLVRTIDGDTIEVDSKRVRLFGIDAPEIGQPCMKNGVEYDCGLASKRHLEYLITGAPLDCEDLRKDKWGRNISVCTADGKDIGQTMVRHGWAIAYTEYSEKYVADEQFARENELGVWSKEFETPSSWRTHKRGTSR